MKSVEVLFTFGYSTVRGKFDGEVKRENGFLVITGVITYNFWDQFKDPASFVEKLMALFNLTRREAEAFVGEGGDFVGTVYDITDSWQTKFNATVKL